MEKGKAFSATMFLFSIVNYFVIGWIVRQAAGPAEEKDFLDGCKPTTEFVKIADIDHGSKPKLESVPRGGWFASKGPMNSLRSFVLTTGDRVKNPALHSKSASLQVKST